MTGSPDAQYQYEQDSDAQAAADRLEELREAAAAGDPSTPRAHSLLIAMYEDVLTHIQAQAAIPTRGMGGKYKGWLRAVPAEVAALLSMRVCIQHCSVKSKAGKRGVTVQKLTGHLGRMLELEVLVREAEKVNPMYMEKIHEQIKERATKSEAHIRKVYSFAYDRVMKGELDSRISESDAMHLGKFGVQACIDAGLIEMETTTNSRGILNYYVLTPEADVFLMAVDSSDVARVVSHSTGAMMCPPEPWTALHGGGYLTERRKIAFPLMNLRAVRRSERKRLREEFTIEKMPKVFGTANYLQGVAFNIHQPTLEAIRRVWTAGGGVLGVPKRERPEKPVFPFPEDWIKADAPENELAVFTDWKRRTAAWHSDLKDWRAKVREVGGFIRQSDNHQGPLWFPVMCDTRGRWYYNGGPNPQGSDMAKAVLHFNRKKRLGSDGFYWLRVAIANNSGFDKADLDERAQWTTDNWPMFVNALETPEDYPEVWGTDSPWCVYSAVYELNQALQLPDPRDYETAVPVHVDATCSGLQHFSAMLRDEVGGEWVNLLPPTEAGAPKKDIYRKVAQVVIEQAEEDAKSSDPKTAEIAKWWLGQGADRSLAKKPVMTYVYSATVQGTIDHIDLTLHKKGIVAPTTELTRPFDYYAYMSKALFAGIAKTAPASAAAMEWLKLVARNMGRFKRMEWTTPTGFKVQHDYQDYDETRVKLRSCGVTDIIVREPNDKVKTSKMQNAVAPNFIHSLDASHMSLVALRMRDLDYDMVAIHDSFGTHPCDVPKLNVVIREEFIGMYANTDVLGEFLWENGIVADSLPRGKLDLSRIKDSPFAFC